MANSASVPAAVSRHGLASLSHSERLAAERALSKLQQSGSALGKHLSSTVENATVAGGSRAASLGTPALLTPHHNDTFMGGARSATLSHGGDDTVLSGSLSKLGTHAPTLSSRATHNLTLSNDTIRVAGMTAITVHTHQRHGTSKAHTIKLADKTTIKIGGLSAHDISKLHH